MDSAALCIQISADLHALNLKLARNPTFRASHTAIRFCCCLRGYNVHNCFCRGSFSEVYLVRERKTGNFYALKCVKKKQLHHSNLENEIKVLRRCKKKQDTNTRDQYLQTTDT